MQKGELSRQMRIYLNKQDIGEAVFLDMPLFYLTLAADAHAGKKGYLYKNLLNISESIRSDPHRDADLGIINAMPGVTKEEIVKYVGCFLESQGYVPVPGTNIAEVVYEKGSESVRVCISDVG